MASRLDPIAKAPVWQLALIWLGVSAVLGAGWYFIYYSDAVAARVAAEGNLAAAQGELTAIEKKLANFEQAMEEAAKQEAENEELKRKLPLSTAAIDHLMRKFQQQGRLVGVEMQNWSPGSESRMEFYAKIPVSIQATGTWHQFGEFFRRISEMEQIVNVEEVQMAKLNASKPGDGGVYTLQLSFKASTFRFIENAERTAGAGDTNASSRRRRTDGEG